jgi:phosphate-selective porin OprO/OprP
MRLATLSLAALLPGLALAQPAAQANGAGTAAAPAATPPAATPPAVNVTADDSGFRLRSADRAFDLRLRGDAQADGRFFVDDADALGVDQFYLRRARLILQGTVGGRYDFKLQPNFGQGTVEIQDAFVDARFSPAFAVQAGKFKVPLGLEWLRSPTDIALIELGLPSALVPRRDIGLMLHGGFGEGRVGYELGVFNGAGDGQNLNGDANDSKEFAARLFGLPLKGVGAGPLEGLGLGFAVTFGEETGTVAATGVPTYRTTGTRTFARFRATTADSTTVLADGQRLRYSPQAYFFAGPVGLLGELVVSQQEVRLDEETAELSATAWQVQGQFFLTGEDAAYGRVRPRRPFGADGGFGAVEVAARYHALAFDEDAFPTFANPSSSAQEARAWSVGLNWYPSGNVKAMVNFERTSFSLAEAAPDTAVEPAGENLVLSRIQIAF